MAIAAAAVVVDTKAACVAWVGVAQAAVGSGVPCDAAPASADPACVPWVADGSLGDDYWARGDDDGWAVACGDWGWRAVVVVVAACEGGRGEGGEGEGGETGVEGIHGMEGGDGMDVAARRVFIEKARNFRGWRGKARAGACGCWGASAWWVR